MRRYQAIIFDLDGTLRESKPHFMDAMYGILVEKNFQIDPELWQDMERWVHQYWAHSPEVIEDFERYGEKQVWNRFLARIMARVGYPHADDEAVAAFGEYVREAYHPVSELTPGTWSLLTKLQMQDYRMGVLSNRGKPFTDELETLGIAHFFDFTLAAGEIGVWKPRPEIFEAALQRAGVRPKQALYVGDNYYADIEGARGAGMAAILVDWRQAFVDVPGPRVEQIADILPYIIDA